MQCNCYKPMKCNVIGGAAIIVLCYSSNGSKPLTRMQAEDEQTAPAGPSSAAPWYPRNSPFPPHPPQTRGNTDAEMSQCFQTYFSIGRNTRRDSFCFKASFTSIIKSYFKNK